MRVLIWVIVTALLSSCSVGVKAGKKVAKQAVENAETKQSVLDVCKGNLDQLSKAEEIYKVDYQKYAALDELKKHQEHLPMKINVVSKCPTGPEYKVKATSKGYAFSCQGDHSADGLAAGFPKFHYKNGLATE